MIEKRTLAAENARRQATGEAPFVDWSTYQANLEALAEERSAMKEKMSVQSCPKARFMCLRQHA